MQTIIKCKDCGKILSDKNQFHQCLVPLTLVDNNGKVLSEVKTISFNSGIRKAAKLANIPKRSKNHRALRVTVVVEENHGEN